MAATQIFTDRIEELAEDFFEGFCDGEEACEEIRNLMHNPKWNRRIRLYMEINSITTLHGLYKDVRNWYAEMDHEKDRIWNDFFPNDDGDDDCMEDLLTDDI